MRLSGDLYERMRVDLEHDLRPGEGLDDDARRNWVDIAEMLADHRIDGGAIGAVGNVDGDFADVIEAGARFLEQGGEVAQGEVGLRRGILRTAARSDGPAVECRAGLAANEQLAGPRRDHRALPGEVLAVPIGIVVGTVALHGGCSGRRSEGFRVDLNHQLRPRQGRRPQAPC